MVIGAFPIAKLGSLVLKQVSKPIANAVSRHAKNSPIFRNYFIIPPAQFYNWCEVKAKMWILNLGRPVNVPVLNEKMAIELGANLLGEGIVFVIAAGIVINEFVRSSRKETAKEEKKRQEMDQIHQTLQELFFTIETQGTQIKELTRYLHDLESRTVHKPWASKKPKSDDDQPPPPPSGSLPPIITLQEVEIREQPDDEIDSKSQMEIFRFADRSSAFGVEPILTIEEVEFGELIVDGSSKAIYAKSNDKLNSGLLLRAVGEIEEELFTKDKGVREESILTAALNFFYKDVYRVNLSI